MGFLIVFVSWAKKKIPEFLELFIDKMAPEIC